VRPPAVPGHAAARAGFVGCAAQPQRAAALPCVFGAQGQTVYQRSTGPYYEQRGKARTEGRALRRLLEAGKQQGLRVVRRELEE